jgi:hypothetical protein
MSQGYKPLSRERTEQVSVAVTQDVHSGDALLELWPCYGRHD